MFAKELRKKVSVILFLMNEYLMAELFLVIIFFVCADLVRKYIIMVYVLNCS